MRHLFTLILLCASFIATGQVQRGDHLVTLGGQVDPYTAADLGAVRFQLDSRGRQGGISTTYGYALTDRLVIGSSLATGGGLFAGSATGVSGYRWYGLGLQPYLRYYAHQTADMGVYGQVSSPIGYNDGDFHGFEALTATAGLQFPVARNVRLGPTVNYLVQPGRNRMSVAANLELVLGERGEGESVVPALRRGSIMLGAQFGELAFARHTFGGGARLGGHYFLTDRLAAGVVLGFSTLRLGSPDATSDFSVRGASHALGLDARYYLTTARRLVWYLAAGADYNFQRYRYGSTFDRSDEERSSAAVHAALGLQYFLRENVALEFGPKFSYGLGDFATSEASFTVGARFFLR